MLIVLAILFPICCGIALWLRHRRTGQDGHTLYKAAVLITDALALAAAIWGRPVTLCTFSPRVTLTFSVDALGRWFLAAALVVYTCVLFYALVYMKIKEREPTFFMFYFISLGALIAVCFSANMVTIYLAFELTTLSTVPLVLHDQTKASVAAGMKFLFYSIGGALLGLFGVFFLYAYAADPTSFAGGGVLDMARVAGHERILYLATFLGVVGYGTKAGMFPMHGWLPTAHPLAPAPASALLSGIITKSGILVVVRFIYYSVGTDFLQGSWMQYAWIALALISVFMGSMMAYLEHEFKRRLAYSSVSQLSYIMLGLALLSQEGLEGGLLQVLQHAPSKACLFLCAGAFIYRYGLEDVRDLKGIGRKMPITLWCLTFAAMSLVGIPPMGGFLSKWHLFEASLKAPLGAISIIAPVVLLISALLTAGYLFPVMINGFFPGKDTAEIEDKYPELQPPKAKREAVPALMWVPLIVLCLASLLIGLFGDSLAALFNSIV